MGREEGRERRGVERERKWRKGGVEEVERGL